MRDKYMSQPCKTQQNVNYAGKTAKEPNSAAGTPSCRSHDGALALVGRRVRVLGLLDLLDEKLEGLGDADVVAGAGLGPGAAELLSELLPFLNADLSLLGSQIALVADDADGYLLRALFESVSIKYEQGKGWGHGRAAYDVVKDLLADDADHLE
jgi:hypothetical protein